jgi:hypothetical protein
MRRPDDYLLATAWGTSQITRPFASRLTTVQKARVILAEEESLVAEEPEVEGDRCLDTFEAVLLERASRSGEGLVAVCSQDDEFADDRVVERRDLVTCKNGRVRPKAWSLLFQKPRRGQRGTLCEASLPPTSHV